METMFIVRLLDKDRQILAWNRIPAETRGDGGMWAKQHFVAEAEATGEGVSICFHWPDVHVYQTKPLSQAVHTDAGKVVTVPIMNDPMIHIASEALPLPGVTEKRNVTIGVGAGNR